MYSRLVRLLGLILVALPPTPSAADTLPLLPDGAASAWHAVGRVNAGGHRQRGMCSGVLVAPDRVLTAAHCLFRADGRPVPLDDLHFAAGWNRGRVVASSPVAAVEIHPKAIQDTTLDPARDLALLRLSTPLTVTPLPLLGRDLAEPPYAIVAYQRSRPHALSARFDCDLRLQKFTLALTSCAVEKGASGGPLLVQVDEVWHVAGVVSARGDGWTLVPRALDWVAQTLADP
ncbi:MAG: trypsin-like peptidase domain-containing protein [Pseudomonadota bacterium]